MAKTATETRTKAATKAANTKTKAPKADVEDKPKRAPSAYQTFCKEKMKTWNEENPGRAKEAMAAIAAMWRDAPENPNRGQEPKQRKAKEPKEVKEKPVKEPKAPKEKVVKEKPAPKEKKPASKAKPASKPASKAKPASKSKPASKKKVETEDELDEDDDDAGDESDE